MTNNNKETDKRI